MPGNRCPNLTLEKLIRSVRRVQETCSDKAENNIGLKNATIAGEKLVKAADGVDGLKEWVKSLEL